MTVSIVQSGSQTAVISTEHTLAETGGGADLPVGSVYELNLDLANMQAGDTLEVRLYTKVRAADTGRVYDLLTLSGVQSEPNLKSVPIPTGAYTKLTIKQTAGTGRAYPWAVYSL